MARLAPIEIGVTIKVEDDGSAWTIKDGRSNSSDEYLRLVAVVSDLIRDGAAGSVLDRGWVDMKARLIVAQLAHRHNVGPLS